MSSCRKSGADETSDEFWVPMLANGMAEALASAPCVRCGQEIRPPERSVFAFQEPRGDGHVVVACPECTPHVIERLHNKVPMHWPWTDVEALATKKRSG